MASKDDSPTSLHGQPWSVWADRLGRDSPLSDTDEQSKVSRKKEGDAMKLPREDMTYYGLCPVRDEFYLVTCNYCRRVCTPQGLKSHIESKHAQEWTSCSHQGTDTADSCAPPATSTSSGSTAARPKAAKKAQAAGQAATVPTSLAYLLATPAAAPQVTNRSRGGSNKRVAGKPTAVLPAPLASALTGTSYDKIPSPQQPPPAPSGPPLQVQFSPLQPTLTAPSPVSPLTAATGSGGGVLTPSPAITMTVAVDSSGNQTVQIHLPELGNGVMLADSPVDMAPASAATASSVSMANRSNGPLNTSASGGSAKKRKNSKGDGTGRRLLPLKERELDLEKHCGVWISDINRACTRSLTCKAHSLTLRRNVQGRSRSFDDLLAEHRAAKELAMKQLKDGTTAQAVLPQGSAIQPPSATKTMTLAAGVQQVPKLGRPPLSSRAPPAKKLLTSLLQHQQQPAAELSLSVELPPAETTGVQQMPSSGLLQRVSAHSALPLHSASTLTFTPHHPKPLAVCSFGLRRRHVLGVVTSDRKWDFLRTAIRSSFLRPAAAAAVASTGPTAMKPMIGRSPVSSGLQSLLRPSLAAQQQQQQQFHHQPLQPRETNSIELPNGLQLSIGVQPEGNKVRLKKSLMVNGMMTGNQNHSHDQMDSLSDDLMEGFDGLVGEDGVLTFLNQGTEGTASLSLMADLSAGNITFSELNNQAVGNSGVPTRLIQQPTVASSSTTSSASFLLQPDLGDFM